MNRLILTVSLLIATIAMSAHAHNIRFTCDSGIMNVKEDPFALLFNTKISIHNRSLNWTSNWGKDGMSRPGYFSYEFSVTEVSEANEKTILQLRNSKQGKRAFLHILKPFHTLKEKDNVKVVLLAGETKSELGEVAFNEKYYSTCTVSGLDYDQSSTDDSSQNCKCEVFPGNYMGVVLFHSSEWGKSGIKKYPLQQNQLSQKDIERMVDACKATIKDLGKYSVCE